MKLLVLISVLLLSLSAMAEGVKLETLSKDLLAGFKGAEVIISRVTVEPGKQLPKHWHPGEEFAYVISGEVTLWQEGKDDIVVTAGQVIKVPLKQVHTAMTTDQGVELIVFRIHESGKPERILVDQEE